ncbi:hypothetical protein CEXT_476011 [Caerostris extrusa]|uniref:Uncharacterized protein n=1 Tax=Caerostris extrusa TaxID=172846 RepID=A0AAV4U1Q1_CAEEX|nr:hypothetical protein CEXT_476011 [Caerostris extrusa]
MVYSFASRPRNSLFEGSPFQISSDLRSEFRSNEANANSLFDISRGTMVYSFASRPWNSLFEESPLQIYRLISVRNSDPTKRSELNGTERSAHEQTCITFSRQTLTVAQRSKK